VFDARNVFEVCSNPVVGIDLLAEDDVVHEGRDIGNSVMETCPERRRRVRDWR
jgi:hypothetical protein